MAFKELQVGDIFKPVKQLLDVTYMKISIKAIGDDNVVVYSDYYRGSTHFMVDDLEVILISRAPLE